MPARVAEVATVAKGSIVHGGFGTADDVWSVDCRLEEEVETRLLCPGASAIFVLLIQLGLSPSTIRHADCFRVAGIVDGESLSSWTLLTKDAWMS